ncbi:transcription antitermination factor NusB [Reichenbachiella versicolor]|uniref:transcription antitermination factor NusB n=1 Tax=Reichenbachiella versicolor TaxID=1821036 RepID=UPI0013A5AE74|nr:transcription antitermination factor NusB [Reichenbachiella versicolor]
MQALFAYQTNKVAEYNIHKKKAQDQFLPDLDSMEEQDKEALALDRDTTAKVFDIIHDKGIEAVPEDTKEEIIKEAKFFLSKWEDKAQEMILPVKKKMVNDLQSIYDEYIKLLVLIISVENEIGRQKRKRNITHNNFAKSGIIKALKNFEELEVERVKKNISWDDTLINTWYKEILKNEEFFQEYDDLNNPKIEDDIEFALTFYKQFIFKNEDINNYFESDDLNWAEDKTILRSMVLKTIKSIENENSTPLLMELSKNWEEDLEFLKELFDLALEHEDEYLDRIQSKSKNWEIERVAITDRILLEMAIAEMTHFPSIPVKVTINEYIELSKQYSTPKSKQFVNGLLDVLSVDLQKEGAIKKSGRGLLDNK